GGTRVGRRLQHVHPSRAEHRAREALRRNRVHLQSTESRRWSPSLSSRFSVASGAGGQVVWARSAAYENRRGRVLCRISPDSRSAIPQGSTNGVLGSTRARHGAQPVLLGVQGSHPFGRTVLVLRAGEPSTV